MYSEQNFSQINVFAKSFELIDVVFSAAIQVNYNTSLVMITGNIELGHLNVCDNYILLQIDYV